MALDELVSSDVQLTNQPRSHLGGRFLQKSRRTKEIHDGGTARSPAGTGPTMHLGERRTGRGVQIRFFQLQRNVEEKLDRGAEEPRSRGAEEPRNREPRSRGAVKAAAQSSEGQRQQVEERRRSQGRGRVCVELRINVRKRIDVRKRINVRKT
ncbi:unnamed protein product [Pleuronectes platessa]|uniref:Uncharacterized protein n=1 Tax=Pleuronectes platessa TaxID=8262 RepID=A0A9N7UQT9_PLEPL|nr:unnamed protein product [Pleuronectes platessa]